MAQHVHDLVAGDFFREEEHVHAHVLEQQFVLRGQVVLIGDAGDDPLGAQFLGQQGADDVDALGLMGIDGDEKVRVSATGILEDADGGEFADDGGYIRLARQPPDAFLVAVDDRDVVGLLAQHLGQMRTHLSGTFNDYLHTKPFNPQI